MGKKNLLYRAMVTKKEAKIRAKRLAEVLKCPHSEVKKFSISYLFVYFKVMSTFFKINYFN